MITTCPNGHQLWESAQFCPQCGVPLAPPPGGYGAYGGYPPPPPPPPTYQPYPGSYQPSWMAPPPRSTNGMAIASLVLGILWIWGIGSILALIFGYIGLSQIRKANENGRGMAIAGIVLGWVGVAGTILLIIVLAIAASHNPSTNFGSSTYTALRALSGAG